MVGTSSRPAVFSYPNNIVQEIRDAWDEPMPREWDVPSLPQDTALRTLLEVVYHASFTADERRASRFSLVLCNPSDAHGAIVFRDSRPLSVREITRLAPAGDIDTLAIGVAAYDPREIHIWGLVPDPGWAFPILAAPAPGSLELRRCNRTVFTLHNGSASTAVVPTIYQSFLNEIFQSATDTLLAECGGIMGGSGFNPEWLYSDPLLDLLRAASRHGHGATVFVLPHGLADSARWRHLFNIKYALDDRTMWPALKRAILADYSEDASRETNSSRLARRRVGVWPDLMSKLTRIDGGLLITDRFRTLGFGVEVVAHAADLRAIRLANNGTMESIDEYGTRHRSAFRLCHDSPDVVAFVCSQDGGIKCVRNVNGVVTLWK